MVIMCVIWEVSRLGNFIQVSTLDMEAPQKEGQGITLRVLARARASYGEHLYSVNT